MEDSKRRSTPRSAWGEETRQKQNEWKKENRMKCAADVPREVGESFRAWCAAQNKTVSAVLADYIYSIVGRPEDRRAATDPTEDRAAPAASGAERTGGPEDGRQE